MLRHVLGFARHNTIAVIALFVALGGTSYAAVATLAKNSVGTAQIKNGAVTKLKIEGATIAALKDGPAVELGNMKLTGAGCELGAASGLSNAGGCALGVPDSLAVTLPADSVFAGFEAKIPSPVASNVVVNLSATDYTIIAPRIGCTIPIGDTSCTSAGPTGTIPAGSGLILLVQTTSATSVSFGYEIGTPAGLGAAAHSASPGPAIRLTR